MKIELPKIKLKTIISLVLLILVIFAATKSRLTNIPNLVADYDPWWFYRHANEVLQNNLKPPKWDELSFYPPGRPFSTSAGWFYIIILFYKILALFTDITFMKAAIISPAIMTGLSALSAYLLGKELTNEWGGLSTAIFASMTPTFIGVSTAGYLDTDVVVVFFSFLSIFTIFLAMREKKWYHIALAVIANFAFINSWWFGWYVLLFFCMLIPVFFLYKIVKVFLGGSRKINLTQIFTELKDQFWPLILLFIILNVVSLILGNGSILLFIQIASGFRQGAGSLVNVSVAELQPINVLTRGGFNAIADRVGKIPMYFMILGLPLLAGYKLYKRVKIGFEELFLFMWAVITFYIILSGVRFALLFSIAVAASAGYVIGNLIEHTKNFNLFFRGTILGLIFYLVVIGYFSQNLAFAMNVGTYDIGQNWVDMLDWLKDNADKKALVATWWDPGHIITGYTGLRVHGDGAHCGGEECVPYDHDIRIQDMGRIMSTNNETEAVNLLKKYTSLTPEQCEQAKKKWGSIMPSTACDPVSELYFIASNDLIGKFTWMNYFGGYRAPISSPADFQKTPGVCCASTPNTEPGQMSCGEFAAQGKGLWVWCPWVFNLQSVQKDREENNVLVYDYGGLKLSIVEKKDAILPVYNNKYLINNVVFYSQDGKLQRINLATYPTTLEKIDGMIWLQQDFRSGIYLSPSIKDSIFVKTFFFGGEGLKHFKPVYSNPEIRIYKVEFN